jgi:hypothetical protein
VVDGSDNEEVLDVLVDEVIGTMAEEVAQPTVLGFDRQRHAWNFQ